MEPHPRLRRAALVSGAVVSVLLVGCESQSPPSRAPAGRPDGSPLDVQPVPVRPNPEVERRDAEASIGEPDRGPAPKYFRFFPASISSGPQDGVVTPASVGIRMTNSIGFALRKGAERGLSVVNSQPRAGWYVAEGEQAYTLAELMGDILDPANRIARFAVDSESVLVQIEVSPDSTMRLPGAAARSADPEASPCVTDTTGKRYECIGFVHRYEGGRRVRYTPSTPVRATSHLPDLAAGKPGEALTLLFLADRGAEINRFVIGQTIIGEWPDTPLLLDQRMR